MSTTDSDKERSKVTLLGTHAVGLAHALGSQLNPVIQSLEYIAKWIDEDPLSDSRRERLKDSAQVGLERARAIFDLVQAMKAVTQPTPADANATEVGEAVRKALTLTSYLWHGKAKISAMPGSAAYVLASRADLLQIFVPIIENAAQAISDGNADVNEITINISQAPKHVLIEISDTGCGIPPDLIDRIFDAHVTTKAEQGGTGLGLYASHTIARLHGGSVTARSEVGKGSTFRVALPSLNGRES